MNENREFFVSFVREQTLGMSVRAKDANEARQLAEVALRDVEEHEWETNNRPQIIDVDGPL